MSTEDCLLEEVGGVLPTGAVEGGDEGGSGIGPLGGPQVQIPAADAVEVERRGEWAALCRWAIGDFSKVKARALWSRYFEVGGYDCRLLVYPKGDSQALPGYLSIYLQVADPRGASSPKWDCFASYKLAVVNQKDDAKSVARDSWHRFSAKKKSHGWCDFSPCATLLDPRAGFLSNDTLVVAAEILILSETMQFTRDAEPSAPPNGSEQVMAGKLSWTVHNFTLFRDMIKSQKIMSPVFPAGECSLRLSVYQSCLNNTEFLSMCLESKDTDKSNSPAASTGSNTQASDRSCWCLFRMSVLHQGGKKDSSVKGQHMHRDSYGRFAADAKGGDSTSLGWNDYVKMAEFVDDAAGYLVDDTVVFSASFQLIKESSSFSKLPILGNSGNTRGGSQHMHLHHSKKHQATHAGGECYNGKFSWRIENFTKLKDLLKKRKITGLCIKSRRFQVGGRDCRLIVYPRGQSQPPCHLSMFLEVTDPRNAPNWSCFVSHRLSVVNQKAEGTSVTKESQNRYSKSAKDWGWREFVTLTSLFDQDAGFLVADTVVFSAEVLILKETAEVTEGPPPLPCPQDSSDHTLALPDTHPPPRHTNFIWRVENFVAFKEIMETRKIFSKYFQAGSCELRIGVYESFDTLCIYLESDGYGAELERNFWVRYRISVENQKHASRSVCKESSICTRTWNNSVLQFMKVSDMMHPNSGFILRDTVILTCTVLECCAWFDFNDMEVYASDDEGEGSRTSGSEELAWEEEQMASRDHLELFHATLARAGLQLRPTDNLSLNQAPSLLDPFRFQVMLQEKLLMDSGAVAVFLAGLRLFLDEPTKVKRLLVPTVCAAVPTQDGTMEPTSPRAAPSVMQLLMGVSLLQQPVMDLFMDVLLECCCHQSGLASAERAGIKSSRGFSGTRSMPAIHPSAEALPIREGAPAAEDACSVAPGGDSSIVGASGHMDHMHRRAEIASGSHDEIRSQATIQNSAESLDDRLENSNAGESISALPVLQITSATTITDVPTPPCSSSALTTHLVSLASLSPTTSSTPGPDSTQTDSSNNSIVACASTPDAARVRESPIEAPNAQEGQVSQWPGQAEELLKMIVNALHDVEMCGTPTISGPTSPTSTVKISMLLQVAPPNLHPDLVLLVPKVVDSSEHHAIAATLLARLKRHGTSSDHRVSDFSSRSNDCPKNSSASNSARNKKAASAKLRKSEDRSGSVGESPGCSVSDRASVVRETDSPGMQGSLLAALCQLRLDPAQTAQVLQLALDMLPMLSTNLPPVIRFILETANEKVMRETAVGLVRQCMRTSGDSMPGLMEAVRAGMCARRCVARAMLTQLTAECLSDPPTLTTPRLVAAQHGGGGMGEESRSEADSSAGHSALDLEEGEPSGVGLVMDNAREETVHAPGGAIDGEMGRMVDMEMLLELVVLPETRSEAVQVLEKGLSRGVLTEPHLVAVLHRRHEHHLAVAAAGEAALDLLAGSSSFEGLREGGAAEGTEEYVAQVQLATEEEFDAMLLLAEVLLRSGSERARSCAGTLYSILFELCREVGASERMVCSLVERMLSQSATKMEVEIGMEILVGMAREEDAAAYLVLSHMRAVVCAAVSEVANLQKKLKTVQAEARRADTQASQDQDRAERERGTLEERLEAAEEAKRRVQGERKLESQRWAHERKELQARVRAAETQTEWLRGERDEAVARAGREQAALEQRLRDAEQATARARTQRADDVKKLQKDKAELVERVKQLEGQQRQRSKEQSTPGSTLHGGPSCLWCNGTGKDDPIMANKQLQKMQQQFVHQHPANSNGINNLATMNEMKAGNPEMIGHIQREQDMDHLRNFVECMDVKLQAHQDYIQTLEHSLQEEMTRHSPLYGIGIEQLSASQLEALSRIHEDGIRKVRALQMQSRSLQHQQGQMNVQNMNSNPGMSSHSSCVTANRNLSRSNSTGQMMGTPSQPAMLQGGDAALRSRTAVNAPEHSGQRSFAMSVQLGSGQGSARMREGFDDDMQQVGGSRAQDAFGWGNVVRNTAAMGGQSMGMAMSAGDLDSMQGRTISQQDLQQRLGSRVPSGAGVMPATALDRQLASMGMLGGMQQSQQHHHQHQHMLGNGGPVNMRLGQGGPTVNGDHTAAWNTFMLRDVQQ